MLKYLSILFLISFSFFTTKKEKPKVLPNILWLSVEDMSPRLGCYGDMTVPTPNIDKLAANGVKYTNAFTCAGVCAPSRNAIATGRIQSSNGGHNMRTLMDAYPAKTGLPKSYSVVMPEGVKHFAEYLRAAGYYCTNNSKTDYQFDDIPTIWDESSAAAHYKNRAKNQPFFAIFNSLITHESQVWARKNKPLRVDPKKVKLPPYYPDTDSVRLDVARFYSNISEMDDWVGEQMADLEKSGLAENTIVMFWSDHGDGLPYIKREITDRGLRVPFIVVDPFTNKKGIDNSLISSIDWAPTVLSLAHIKTPKNMQGRAFMGDYKSKKPNKYVYAARDRMDSEYDRVRSVHDGQYQYIYNFNPEKPRYMDVEFRKQQASMREILRLRDAGKLNKDQMQWFLPNKPQDELYDIVNDPHQLDDLAQKPAYKTTLERFRAEFTNWQKKVEDYGGIQEKELVKQMWNGGAKPPITEKPKSSLAKNNKIMLSCNTLGASIAYKIISENTAEPKRWEVYKGPIFIPKNSKIKAVAQRIGYLKSEEILF